jgi:hypothetical protein
MSFPLKLAFLDAGFIVLLWVVAVSFSGNPIGFVIGTIPYLIYMCILVSWRVYVRVFQSGCLKLRHAILDGAVAGAFLGAVIIGVLISHSAFAAGVWWDGSDGSNVSDWRLWATHLFEQTILCAILGALSGTFLWFFNAFLLLFPFYKSGLVVRL